MTLPEYMRKVRRGMEVSQQELAKKTDLSQSAIAKWELNKTDPTSKGLIAIAKYFNVSIDYLLGL